MPVPGLGRRHFVAGLTGALVPCVGRAAGAPWRVAFANANETAGVRLEGLGFTGAIANRVLHKGENLADFGPVAAVFAGAVLLICVAPYLAFSPALMQRRRAGLPKYGAFARPAVEHYKEGG